MKTMDIFDCATNIAKCYVPENSIAFTELRNDIINEVKERLYQQDTPSRSNITKQERINQLQAEVAKLSGLGKALLDAPWGELSRQRLADALEKYCPADPLKP